jgi:hypothetical protein
METPRKVRRVVQRKGDAERRENTAGEAVVKSDAADVQAAVGGNPDHVKSGVLSMPAGSRAA